MFPWKLLFIFSFLITINTQTDIKVTGTFLNYIESLIVDGTPITIQGVTSQSPSSFTIPSSNYKEIKFVLFDNGQDTKSQFEASFTYSSYTFVINANTKLALKEMNQVEPSGYGNTLTYQTSSSSPNYIYTFLVPSIVMIDLQNSLTTDGYNCTFKNIVNENGEVNIRTVPNESYGKLYSGDSVLITGSMIASNVEITYKPINNGIHANIVTFSINTSVVKCVVFIVGYKGFQCTYDANVDDNKVECTECKDEHYQIENDDNGPACYNQNEVDDTYYLDETITPKLWKKCISPCITCTSASVCTECENNLYLKPNGECVVCEENGFYKNNVNTLLECSQCDSSCLTCSDGISCNSCNDGYFILESGLCQDKNTIANLNTYCVLPSSSILQPLDNFNYYYTNNEGINFCLNDCSSIGYMNLLNTKQCVNCNSAGYLAKNGLCYECDPHCTNCIGEVDKCTGCSSGYTWEAHPYQCFQLEDIDKVNYCLIEETNAFVALQTKYIEENGIFICLDNCKDKQYYTLEDSGECVSSCPNGYLQSNSNNEYMCYVCDVSCKTCIYKTEFCTECEDGYHFMETNPGMCYTKDEIPKYEGYCLDTSLNTYHAISPSQYFYIDDNGDKMCISSSCGGNYKYPQLENTFECGQTCPKGHFITGDTCSKCYKLCESCNEVGDDNDHKCISCIDEYDINPLKQSMCYKKCKYKFYFDNNDDLICLGEGIECPSNFKYIVKETNQCVNSCTDPLCHLCQINQMYILSGYQCVTECPFGFEINGNICEAVYLENSTTEGSTMDYASNMNADEFKAGIDNTKDIAMDNIQSGLSTTIQGDNYIYTFYNPSDPSQQENIKTKIDLGECEDKLRSHYNIPSNEDIFISTLSFNNYTTSLSYKTQYVVYDKNGNELDLTPCEGTKVTVTTPINLNNTNLDIATLIELQEQGINPFDPNDPVYTDNCIPFTTEDGRDMPLGARGSDLFENVSLCDEGCDVKDINYTSMEVECECQTTSEGFDALLEENEMLGQFKDLFENSNLYMFTCYKNIFRFSMFFGNYGSMIIISCVISYIGLYIIFYCVQLEQVYACINTYVSNPPPVQKKVDKTKGLNVNRVINTNTKQQQQPRTNVYQLSSDNKKLTMYNDDIDIRTSMADISEKGMIKKYSRQTSIDAKSSTELTQSQNKDTNDNNNTVSNVFELNEMDYDEAIKYDKRSYLRFLLDLIIQNNIIFCTILGKYVFYPISLRIITLIFVLSGFFFFNGVFFSEEYITQRYNSKSKLNFVYIIQNELEKSIYSSLLVMILEKLVMIVVSINSDFYKIINNKDDDNNFSKQIRNIVLSFKKRLLILFIIIIILSIFFWYFLAIFCSIFQNNQISWIEATLISIAFNVIISIVLCFLLGSLKYCSIRKHNSLIFKLSDFLLDLV